MRREGRAIHAVATHLVGERGKCRKNCLFNIMRTKWSGQLRFLGSNILAKKNVC